MRRPGKIIEPDVIVVNADEEWDLEGIVVVKEGDGSRLCGKTRALQKKCHIAIVEAPSDMLVDIVLAKRSLDLSCQVSKREQALVKVEQKFEGASSTASEAQYSAPAVVGDVYKCRGQLEDEEERL